MIMEGLLEWLPFDRIFLTSVAGKEPLTMAASAFSSRPTRWASIVGTH